MDVSASASRSGVAGAPPSRTMRNVFRNMDLIDKGELIREQQSVREADPALGAGTIERNIADEAHRQRKLVIARLSREHQPKERGDAFRRIAGARPLGP